MSFSYELENIGNRPVTYNGEIRIYDRKGQELTSIPLKSDTAIALDEKLKLASNWSGSMGSNLDDGKQLLAQASEAVSFAGMWKYKAILDLEYGNAGKTIQDTVFFWVIPWKQIMVIFLVLLIFITILAMKFHKRIASSKK